MRKRLVLLGSVVFLAAPLLTMRAAVAVRSAPRAAPARAVCVFSNPTFSGKCVERAEIPKDGTPEEACGTILSCLNDSRCLKTYCSATQIRGGWKLDSAKPEAASN